MPLASQPQSRSGALALTRLVSAIVCAGALAGCTDVTPPDSPALATTRGSLLSAAETVPGQYIVVFRDDVDDGPGLARQLVAQAGGEMRHTYTAALRGFAARLPEHAAEALRHNPHVAAVEPDQLARAEGVQLRPRWGLDRIDQRALPLDSSFAYDSAGTGVDVYIIDTGIRTTHVEFGGRAVDAYNAVRDGRSAEDCNGHGTHVAGVAAGALHGVAKAARVHAVRVLDCSGSGTVSDVIAGVDWVTRNRVLPAVANMSLVTPTSSTLNSAVLASIRAGVVYAVAAGNDGADACRYSPASTGEALTVGASDATDAMAAFSNYGGCVDLVAPGVSIKAAFVSSDSALVSYSGTSMAAPHVAGAAALYLSRRPAATPSEVASALLGSATSGALTSLRGQTPDRLLYTRFADSDTGTAPAPAPTPTPTPTPTPSPAPPPADAAPTVTFKDSCQKGTCTFDGSGSSDDTGITAWDWSFGDGTTQSGPSVIVVKHAFLAKGSFTVTLTVTDKGGKRASASRTVTIRKL